MTNRALAEQLQRDQVLATRALASLMLNELPDEVRSRVHQAIHDGTGYIEPRTRIDTGQVELLLVPTEGSEDFHRPHRLTSATCACSMRVVPLKARSFPVGNRIPPGYRSACSSHLGFFLG
jgi:hypothetical protein